MSFLAFVATAIYFFFGGIIASEITDAKGYGRIASIMWGLLWPATLLIEAMERHRLRSRR